MAFVEPVFFESRDVRLSFLELNHVDGLRAATSDGQFWGRFVAYVPVPEDSLALIKTAHLTAQRFAFAVTNATISDAAMYSLRASEWPEAKAQLLHRLDQTHTRHPMDISPC